MPPTQLPQLATKLRLMFPSALAAGPRSDDARVAAAVSEESVREFFQPLELKHVAIGFTNDDGVAEIYVHFASNEDCGAGQARGGDGDKLGGLDVEARFA